MTDPAISDPSWKLGLSADAVRTTTRAVRRRLDRCPRGNDRSILNDIRGRAGNWGSVLPAFWSFMLATQEHGLGTAWTTAHLDYEKEIANFLGIPFDPVVQRGLTPVAYTVSTDFKPGSSAAATAFTHWDRW